MKISQSLLKDYLAYLAGELCGSIFKARWVTGTWGRDWMDSDSMALGRYFEFLINKERPSGYKSDPKPKFLKSASEKDRKALKVDKMMKPYQLAHDKAAKLIDLMETSGIEIIEAQKYYERDGLEGTVDLICDFVGERVVIDIKYSGLIDDKWSPFGWTWSDKQKITHGLQAKQYKYITGYDVYFLVVSSGNDSDIRLFKPKITSEMLESHVQFVNYVREGVEQLEVLGSWQDFPGHKQCGSCPLKNTCRNRAEGLKIEEVEI